MDQKNFSAQKPDFHHVMAAVHELTQDDPMSGLLWLAVIHGKQAVSDLDDRLLSFSRHLVARQLELDPAGLHRLHSKDEILERISDLPSQMSYRPTSEWLGAPVALDLEARFDEARLVCHGLGSGTFETPIRPMSWSVAGIALASNGYSDTPDKNQARSILPSSVLLDICNRWKVNPDREVSKFAQGSFTRPHGSLAPAASDVDGRTYDVADLLIAKLELDTISWLASHTINGDGLNDSKNQLVSDAWGMQAARLSDIARHEYAATYVNEPWAKWGIDPTAQATRVSNAIISIVHAGGNLTPEIWGDRYFGPEMKPEMQALSLAVLDHASLPDDEKLATLQLLRSMGHDVVVAHRARKEFEDEAATVPKVYKELPLDVAIQFDLRACTLALLEWGADAHALTGDAQCSPMQHSLARENDGLAMEVHQILRAHEAKLYAEEALAELAASLGGARP